MEEREKDNGLHELALQAKHGDRKALERLLTDTELRNVIYKIAYERVGSTNADDMYQEVCSCIYQKVRTWRGKSKITDWV